MQRKHTYGAKGKGAKTTAHTRISTLYHYCLWKDGELDHMQVRVVLPDGEVHIFHRRRLDERLNTTCRLLLRVACKLYLRSREGKHYWLMLMHPGDSYPDRPGSSTRRLTALGMASGLITIEPIFTEGMSGPVYIATVEDRRIAYQLSTYYKKNKR